MYIPNPFLTFSDLPSDQPRRPQSADSARIASQPFPEDDLSHFSGKTLNVKTHFSGTLLLFGTHSDQRRVVERQVKDCSEGEGNIWEKGDQWINLHYHVLYFYGKSFEWIWKIFEWTNFQFVI